MSAQPHRELAMTPEVNRIAQALAAGESRPYVPDFRPRETTEGWWLTDRGQPFAFLHRETFAFDPFRFSPWRSPLAEPVCHPRYDMGTRLAMHLALMVNVVGNFRRGDGTFELSWLETGERLVFQLDQAHPNGVWARSVVEVGYRADRAAYTWDLDVTVREPNPPPVRELVNFYARHVGDAIPAQKRWQYTVWQGFDGTLWKLPHNPALTFGLRPGALRKYLCPGGFLGYATEEHFNPVILFHDSNAPLCADTCDLWHDEHLSVVAPGLECWDGGERLIRFQAELVDLPAKLMHGLADAANLVPVDDGERGVPGFYWNRLSSFETAVDPRTSFPGMVFVPGHDRWVEISPLTASPAMAWRGQPGCGQLTEWTTSGGRDGGRCLHLQGQLDRRIAWLATGHVCHIAANRRYVFSAWVRTRGEAKATIRLANCWQHTYDLGPMAATEPVASAEWRQLRVEVETSDYPYLFFWLEVLGDGEVWFDNLFAGPAE